ncbi:glycosyltransferase family 2 protein [Salegentibacter maritimus]|uniref:Glycosyltransferase family 2 protein n=1 Tax=Salegentibacter maritimus TaxID=2794347 RepID=A0ABS0TC39_9FLAO|nr:glycosyltransferase family 2 protein [Salegentibacter maritimus]MBI6118547.1 glycosyltransferase family 2 protein [Salegentibacter maritimus]
MLLEPVISVIIPTFNRAKLLIETIDSFLNQTYLNWEIIIVDDGSKDNTKVQVKAIKDKRINFFIREEQFKKGPAGSRNYGLEKAKGDLILFFDDDDIAHPDLLKEVVLAFSKQNLDFVRYERQVFFGDFNYEFDKTKTADTFFIGIQDLYKMIINKLPFNTCAVIWKREAIGHEKFNENLFYSDEWEFFQRLLFKKLHGINLNKILLYARKHSNSSTGYFKNRDSLFLNSSRLAALLVIENLENNGFFNETLKKYFIRRGFELESYPIIYKSLKAANSRILEVWIYKIGFKAYPVLRPLFLLKGKIFSR